VPPPVGDDAWAECLRDLKRTLEGGGIFVVGRERRTAVDDPAKESGDVTQKACEEAFQELSKRISHELVAQAKGLPPDHTAQGACLTDGCVRPALHDGPCIDGQLTELKSALEECKLDEKAIEAAMRRMAAYVSVAPGMQAIMKHSLPPSLWQPTFAICVGGGQVRVLTLAFVGEPVSGDRPSCKCTPFVLRLLSGDLAATGAPLAPAQYCVRPAIRGVKTITSHLAALEPELFEAADAGEWASISESAAGASTASSRCPSVTPSTPVRPGTSVGPKAQTGGEQPLHVGDRATRMRATFERAQSRPAHGRQVIGASAEAGRADPRDRANSGPMLLANNGRQTPQPERTPGVSVLADGLSVRTVAGALNNVAATTNKIGSLFRRARSPVWFRQHEEQGRNARADTESSAKPLLSTRSMPPDLGTPAKAHPSQKMAPPSPAVTLRQGAVTPTPVHPSAVAPAPVAAVAAAPAPARHVVDRAARMRERINRAQSTAAGKRSVLEPKLAQTMAVRA